MKQLHDTIYYGRFQSITIKIMPDIVEREVYYKLENKIGMNLYNSVNHPIKQLIKQFYGAEENHID